MGLNITAYSKIKKLDVTFNKDGEAINPATQEPLDYDDYIRAFINPHFPSRAADIDDSVAYSFEKSRSFRAGSYSGYNDWREHLAKMVGYPSVDAETDPRHAHSNGACESTEGPFWELIFFSDCEGVIGTAISTKLAKDFADHDKNAAEIGGLFYELYGNWKKAFELAADGGMVYFH